MTVCYFTATGNCLYVADGSAENISKAYSAPIVAKLDGVGTDEDTARVKEDMEKF